MFQGIAHVYQQDNDKAFDALSWPPKIGRERFELLE
jgi:hypothetical protein